MNVLCLLGHSWVDDEDEGVLVEGLNPHDLVYHQLAFLRNAAQVAVPIRSSVLSFIQSWAVLISPNHHIVQGWVGEESRHKDAFSLLIHHRHCSLCGLRQIKAVDGMPLGFAIARRMHNDFLRLHAEIEAAALRRLRRGIH